MSLEAILDTSREEVAQQYLACHQPLLIRALGFWGQQECIPKFKFGNDYVSDFVIVSPYSYRTAVALVELEPPTARPFTKDGKYAERLNDAIGQVNDWLAWIRQNNDYFLRCLAARLQAPEDAYRNMLRDRLLEVIGRIVIGRRSMMSEHDDLRRGSLYDQTSGRIEIIPYDRLLDVEQQLSLEG